MILYIRNYYIHYDERNKKRDKVFAKSELYIYNRSLFYIVEYDILIELDFHNIEKIRQKLNETWERILDTLLIIKHFNKKVNTK